MTKFLLRSGLILSAVTAGILNGSVLAAPVLIFMVYLLCVLVRQGQQAVTLIEEERLRRAMAPLRDYAAYDVALTAQIGSAR